MAEEVIEKFELDVISDRQTGVIAINGKERTWEIAKAIVAQTALFVIQDDAGKKLMKGWHADLNKIISAIDRKRIDTIADFTSDFTTECNELKDFLNEHRLKLNEEIKRYEESQKVVVATGTTTLKKYTATIKFTDEKLIKKLTDFCQKNGCELTIK